MSYDSPIMVFDASTLILIAKIDLLHLFVDDYPGRIMIPDIVEREVRGKDAPDTAAIRRSVASGRIEVVKAAASRDREKIQADLAIDAGEAAAIMLARKKGAALVATDDRNAIRACRLLGIEFVSAPAILVRAVEKGIVSREEGLGKLERLREVGRYRTDIIGLAEKAIREVKQDGDQDGERPHQGG